MTLNANFCSVILLVLISLTSIGCTSSTYGNSFVPISQNNVANQYTLKVYTGGFAGPEYAKKDLDLEAKKFMQQHPEYVDYKVISSTFEMIPSGVTFVVEFIKK